MNRIFSLLCLLILAACGPTLAARHTGCMDMAAAFAAQVACVQDQVMADPHLRDDPLVREYLMTGEKLAADVRQGRIGEDEARLQFIRKLNDVENEQLRRAMAAARIERDTRDIFPRAIHCTPTARGGQNCLTY